MNQKQYPIPISVVRAIAHAADQNLTALAVSGGGRKLCADVQAFARMALESDDPRVLADALELIGQRAIAAYALCCDTPGRPR